MRGRWVYHRSSMLTALPALGLLLAFGVGCMTVELKGPAIALILVFLLAGGARCWSAVVLHKVTVAVDCREEGVFPGQTLEIALQVHNDKFLPLSWMEVVFPLEPGLCIQPEVVRPTDEWEKPTLKEQGWAEGSIGEKRMSSCLWYERVEATSLWTAQHRGVYSIAGWRLRTGDGFGMSQVERDLNEKDVRQLAVYPALVPVNVQPFLQNLWNADTGSSGMMEDTTVIRSTRTYQPGDRLKTINWRLTARGLPLSVNVYEDIMPRSIHFLVDGESFGGEIPHWQQLEEALSILASLLVELTGVQVACGLSLCRGEGPAVHIRPQTSAIPLLRALAAYQPAKPLKGGENHNQILRRVAAFDLQPLMEQVQHLGHIYYITYDCAGLGQQPALMHLDDAMTTLLTWQRGKPVGGFAVADLQQLRKGETA